jgi:acyl carrier protein phosphodiesterase
MYALLRQNEHILPQRTIHMLGYMEPQNWLVKYASVEGLQRALTGLARRTTFESNMENAHRFLQDNYQSFEEEFNDFFPDLRSFVQIALEK